MAATTQRRTNGQRDGSAQAGHGVFSHHGVSFSLPVVGDLNFPPPHHIVWYAGVGALVALECIEWPIALILATGKALADNRHSAMLREMGEALEEAG
jgi:hypothetical protein